MPNPFPIAEQASLPNTRPTHTPDGHRLAVCRPMNHQQRWLDVELIARVGKGLVKVREVDTRERKYFACPPWRLKDPATRQELKRADVADLPWQGAGADPLLEEQPSIAGVKR